MEIQSNMPISPQPEQLPIPKPKKWFQHKGIITIVILIILTVLVSWLALSREPKTELTAVNVTQNSKSVNNYTNNFLHYSLSYPNSWRVAASYSKKLAILKKYSYYAEKSQCFISPDESDEQRAINSLNQCISSKPDFKNFEAEFKDFQLSWKPENSEVIVFTDLSDTAEQTFVNQITAHEKTYLDFPVAYHFIQLNPLDTVLSFQKETPSDSTRKIKLKFYTLPGGIQAYQSDSRLMDSKLSINVPNDFKVQLDNGKPAQSLDVSTNAPQNSKEEKDFFSVVNSIKFSK